MPLTDSYGQSIPYPTLTDKPNAQTLGQGIVEGLTPQTILSYSSANVRGATITSPRAGMQTWLQDVRRMEVYDGSRWVVVGTGQTNWNDLQLGPGYADDDRNNYQGKAQWRIVDFSGERTISFRGGIFISYNDDNQPRNGGIFTTEPLPESAWPTSLRSLSAACSVRNSDTATVKIDIIPPNWPGDADDDGKYQGMAGHLCVVGVGSAANSPSWVSLTGLTCSLGSNT